MKLFAYSFVYLFYFFLKIVWILLYIFSDEKFSANCGNNKFFIFVYEIVALSFLMRLEYLCTVVYGVECPVECSVYSHSD